MSGKLKNEIKLTTNITNISYFNDQLSNIFKRDSKKSRLNACNKQLFYRKKKNDDLKEIINNKTHNKENEELFETNNDNLYKKSERDLHKSPEFKKKKLIKKQNVYLNKKNDLNSNVRYSDNLNNALDFNFKINFKDIINKSQKFVNKIEELDFSNKSPNYGAHTHMGNFRNYNEDRISIILNVNHNNIKNKNKNKIENENLKENKKSHYFGVYDGHGGYKCVDFLKDNLHKFIFLNKEFPSNIENSLKNGYLEADKYYCDNANKLKEFSGSCSISIIINKNICYISNLGDSRVILSKNNGNVIEQITEDHKPENKKECERIIKENGNIYQTSTKTLSINGLKEDNGPWRILPGRLSISRSFGDIEAKYSQYGGNDKILISEPDTFSFKITSDCDFLYIGTDGVYDKLTNTEIIESIYNTFKIKNNDLLKLASKNVNELALIKGSTDNCSSLIISLNNNHLSRQINYNNVLRSVNLNKLN